MKLTSGVEWALHCCVTLSQSETPVSAARLARLHEIPSAYLAKHLQALSQAGILHSTPGPVGGYTFAHPPAQVSILDVVLAIDGPEPAFRCTEIRRKGPLAVEPERCLTPCAVSRAMSAADAAWRAALQRITIADLAQNIDDDSGGLAMEEVRQWLTGRAEPAPSS